MEPWQLKQSARGGVFYQGAFCNRFDTENVLVQITGAIMESWSGVAMCMAAALFMSPWRSSKRGLKMTLVVRRGLFKATTIHPDVQHNVHIISRQDNVILATCGVYRMVPCPSPWSEWPSIHFVRLRHTNLLVSLWHSSQGPLLMTPSPVVLTWQQSHSGTMVVSHHTIHWLCSMGQCCMVWQAQSEQPKLIF